MNTVRQNPLLRFVALFNLSVRDGCFARLALLFAPEASLVFEGLPGDPLEGPAAIAKAFIDQQPQEELVLVETWVEHGAHCGSYRWRDLPRDPGGTLHVVPLGSQIQRLTVDVLV